MKRPLTTLAAIIMLSACGSDSDAPSIAEEPFDDPDEGAGACYIDSVDALIHIEQVLSQPAGTELAQVKIRDITVDGVSIDPQYLDCEDALSHCYRITVGDDVMTCDLPCGFGGNTGFESWELTLVAEHHANKTVTIAPIYHQVSGSCPRVLDQGSHFQFELIEQGY